MRVRLSPASVGWIEDEVQAWIEQRIADRVTR
jgi:predicted DNA-binding transcriptional regulator AlpA